jgi:hypothetical protein
VVKSEYFMLTFVVLYNDVKNDGDSGGVDSYPKEDMGDVPPLTGSDQRVGPLFSILEHWSVQSLLEGTWFMRSECHKLTTDASSRVRVLLG